MNKNNISETKKYISNSEIETENIALDFANSLKSGDFIAFYGDLGSGKTAFVRGLAKNLCPKAKVSSPTFSIVNEYTGERLSIYHFDVYRILDDDNLYSTGFYDYFDRPGVIVVEWSENIPFAIPEKRYDIIFEKISEEQRNITINKYD